MISWSPSFGRHVENNMFRMTFHQGTAMTARLMTPSSPVFPPCVFPSSASGFTSGGPSILAPRLPSASQTTPSGRWWQPTCFTPSLPSWWPCAFTATPIFSSRSPPSLGRQVCPTVWRRTPSTKINSRLEVIWSCDDS